MGVYDEFGEQFNSSDVLNNKMPVNFILDDPTPMKYIDPSFYIHNIAALLLKNENYSAGVHDLPIHLDNQITERWCSYHQTSMDIIQQWFVSF